MLKRVGISKLNCRGDVSTQRAMRAVESFHSVSFIDENFCRKGGHDNWGESRQDSTSGRTVCQSVASRQAVRQNKRQGVPPRQFLILNHARIACSLSCQAWQSVWHTVAIASNVEQRSVRRSVRRSARHTVSGASNGASTHRKITLDGGFDVEPGTKRRKGSR